MHKVTFKPAGGEDVTIFAATDENLLQLARGANVAIDAPCSGNGSCGKCRVKLLDGEVKSEHTRHLAGEDLAQGWRLACLSVPNGNVVVEVPDIASAYRGRLKVADLAAPETLAAFEAVQSHIQSAHAAETPRVRTIDVTMAPPTLDETEPDSERLQRALKAATGAQQVLVNYTALHALPNVLRENGFSARCFVRTHGDALVVERVLPPGDAGPPCGLAVDIGTTTVSIVLASLEDGAILGRASTGNGQIRYGADVINRIIEQGRPGGVQKLQNAIVQETLNPLIAAVCTAANITPQHICEVAAAGNTTMNHLLLALNAEPVRTEPFVPCFWLAEGIQAGDVGLALPPSVPLRLAPNVGSYVGGDITAGAFASMLWQGEELSLFIDLGTNGEVVFGNAEFMMTCACSAGPAFEGGDISCGMRATDGAIEAVSIDKDSMEPSFSVIGGGKTLGICGSGLIDLACALFRGGIISPRGKFIREGARIRHDEYGLGSYVVAHAAGTGAGRDVTIDEVDLDNFIRAKGAIFSAVTTLVESAGFELSSIQRVLVAGGIGSGIDMDSAVGIGMFPDIPRGRFSYIGNSSLTGAYAMLISPGAEAEVQQVARGMTYVELSTTPGYMDAFVAASFLPHTDASLFPSLAKEAD